MFWERDRVTFYENENAAKIISRNKIKLAIKEKDFISNTRNKLLDEFFLIILKKRLFCVWLINLPMHEGIHFMQVSNNFVITEAF